MQDINEGLSYRKYTLIDSQKTHLFEEEVEFLNDQENFEERSQEIGKVENTIRLNSSVDEITKKAMKDAERQDALRNKDTKNTRENRQIEKEANRNTECWEIGESEPQVEDGKVVPIKKEKENEYIPAPNYINIIEDND